MNRQQFAETAARAYVAQFATSGSPVMNQRIIVFDGTHFSSQSSLTPVDDHEVVVMSLEEGIFGDVDADDPDCAPSIESYLTDSASDESWRDVSATIAEAAEGN